MALNTENESYPAAYLTKVYSVTGPQNSSSLKFSLNTEVFRIRPPMTVNTSHNTSYINPFSKWEYFKRDQVQMFQSRI